MVLKEQLEVLHMNYGELEEDKKDKLLLIGKKLLSIKSVVWNEELSVLKAKNPGEEG
jgi:hypothetical protein